MLVVNLAVTQLEDAVLVNNRHVVLYCERLGFGIYSLNLHNETGRVFNAFHDGVDLFNSLIYVDLANQVNSIVLIVTMLDVIAVKILSQMLASQVLSVFSSKMDVTIEERAQKSHLIFVVNDLVSFDFAFVAHLFLFIFVGT